MYRETATILLGALLLAACSAKPETVAQQLAEAVNAGEVERAAELFAEEAVVDTGGPQPYIGREEISQWLQDLAAAEFQIEAEIENVAGDTVTEREWLSMAPWREMGLSRLEGVSTITVENGKIVSLEFAFTDEALEQLRIATLTSARPTYANVPYASDGVAEHVLDIYLPSDIEPPYPAILMIHGDGDEKEQHNGMASFFTQVGFAAVLIDYRDPPHQIADGLCSLAWTVSNASQYEIDPERITLFGFSVGGMLATTMGAVDNPSAVLQDCDHNLPPDGSVLGVAAYEAVLGTPESCLSKSWCYVGAAAATGMPLEEIQMIFESLRDAPIESWRDPAAVGPQAESFAREFPYYWLDGSEPPYLIIHGELEDWVPQAESLGFVDRLQEAGVPVELLIVPGASHQSVYPRSPSFTTIAGAVVEFAKQLEKD